MARELCTAIGEIARDEVENFPFDFAGRQLDAGDTGHRTQKIHELLFAQITEVN